MKGETLMSRKNSHQDGLGHIVNGQANYAFFQSHCRAYSKSIKEQLVIGGPIVHLSPEEYWAKKIAHAIETIEQDTEGSQ